MWPQELDQSRRANGHITVVLQENQHFKALIISNLLLGQGLQVKPNVANVFAITILLHPEVLNLKILRVCAKMCIPPYDTKRCHLGVAFSFIVISNNFATFAFTCKPCPRSEYSDCQCLKVLHFLVKRL